jgi:hypothetical protein
MEFVIAIGERDEQAGIDDALHVLLKPLRVESSRAPLMHPASRMNGRDLSSARARSNWVRTICPCEMPVRFDKLSSQSASSLSMRIVNV